MLVAVLLLTACFSVSYAAPSDGVALQGSKPRNLDRAAHIGAVDESKVIVFSLYLKFRSQDDLDNLLEEQQTPGSSHYQKFLTPDEFHAKYSPLPEDVDKVKNELANLGFRVVYAPKGGLFVTAAGTIAQVKQAFHVTQEYYKIDGKTVRSHAEAPVIPASIAPLVLHIAGLDDAKKFYRSFTSVGSSKFTRAKNSGSLADPPQWTDFTTRTPCNVDFGTPVQATVTPAAYYYSPVMDFTNCGYVPAQIQAAYGANKVKSTGKGIRVGVVDMYLPTTLEHDLNHYSKLHGLPEVNYATFQKIAPPGLSGVPDYDPCDPVDWSVESTLDVEAVHAIAPGADIVYFGDACNTVYPLPMQAVYDAIDNRLTDVLSGSFGGPELDFSSAQEDADNQEFKEAASLGVTLLFSSGDSADYLQAGAPLQMVSWPASSPWVTAVGGTALLLDAKGAGTKSEYGWGSYTNGTYNGAVWTGPFQIEAEGWEGWFFDAGAGGGTSLFMEQPSYQKTVVPKSLSEYLYTSQGGQVYFGAPKRVVPDVAMLADLFTGFLQGQTFLETNPGTLDITCTAVTTPANAEYCEFPEGGTSVASPLFAGVVAIVDSARLSSGKGLLGFANPTLYKLSVGANGSAAPLWDVKPPSHPIALLDEEEDDGGFLLLGAAGLNMDAVDSSNLDTPWILGGDSELMTSKGFDNVTGLGTPWLPGLIQALAPEAK